MPNRPAPRLVAHVLAALAVAGACVSIVGGASAAPARGVPVFSWSHNLSQRWLPTALKRRYTPRAWLAEVDTMLDESGSFGLDYSGYYALPFKIPERYRGEPTGWRTASVMQDRWARTRQSWDVVVEAGTFSAAARAGATDLAPGRGRIAGRISPLDPLYEAVALSELTSAAAAVADRPYVAIYEGLDEPRIPVPRIDRARWPTWLVEADRQVVEEYGFGRFATPRPAESSWARSRDKAFRWIAFNRWASDNYIAQRARLKTTLRAIDADATYTASDLRTNHGLPAFDLSRWGDVADLVETDPYASYAERQARGRGRFNHGFAAKLLSDLTGRPLRVIVQAFDWAGYSPTTDDMVQWTSQALIGGADMISYYELDNPRFTKPERYAAILRLARALRRTRVSREVRPDRRVVVLWSFTSAAAHANWSSGDAPYAAYTLLGPGSGARFKFVSDTQLERREASLAGARLVFLPEGRFLPRSVAAELKRWVRAGGTLVVGDPWAFEFDRDGTSLASLRTHLLGKGLGSPVEATTVRVAPRGVLLQAITVGSKDATPRATRSAIKLARALGGETLPISWLRREGGRSILPARRLGRLALKRSTLVLARYPNGSPAVIERPVGRGRVMYFAASPLTPGAALSPGWQQFTRWILRRSGIATGNPAWRWRLKLPRPGALQLSVMESTITARRLGWVRLRWRVADRAQPRAAVTARVTLRGGRAKNLQFGWALTNGWVTGRAPADLPRGRYRAQLSAVDLAGNRTRRSVPIGLVIR